MNVFRNTILVLLYLIGRVFVDAVCFSRLVFYYDWHFYEDLIIWICAAIVFVQHYALIWIMHKKGKPFVNCTTILQIIDYLLAGSCLIFMVILTVSPRIRIQELGEIYPPFIIHAVALFLRRFLKRKVQSNGGKGSGSVVPSKETE